MTPVKDTIENLAPAAGSSSSRSPVTTKTEPAGLRSDAVSLEVPVRVHGSRVAEVVRDETSHTEPFEEQTSTMIVFPQGGVLKMAAVVNVGQMLVVTNLKSGQDAICRVLKVRAYANTQSYVEVEFTHRQVGYWGVQFPSDVVEAPKKLAPPAAARTPVNPSTAFEIPAQPQAPVTSANTLSATPPPNVRAAVEAAKPPSQFVGIGSHEDVQPSATPTLASRSGAVGGTDFKARGTESPRPAAPPVSPLSPAPVAFIPLTPPVLAAPSAVKLPVAPVEELRREARPHMPEPVQSDEPVLLLEDSESPSIDQPHTASTPPAIRASGDRTNVAGKRAAAREMFGVPLESEKAVTDGDSSKKLIVAVAAVALLAIAGAGGYFFFHQHAAAPAAQVVSPVTQEAITPSAAPAAASQAGAPVVANVTRAAAPSRAVASVAVASPVAPVRERATVDTQQPERSEASAPTASSVAPPVAETHRPSGNVPSLFGALNAHPVASHTASQDDQAPAIPAAAPEALAVIAQPAAGLPAPPTSTKAPRLIFSVLPVYPDFARQRGIGGNVVIQATIEPNGAVGATKVLSGPQPLREAALHALRQWKYESGKVDGQDAPVDVTVTLHFSGK